MSGARMTEMCRLLEDMRRYMDRAVKANLTGDVETLENALICIDDAARMGAHHAAVHLRHTGQLPKRTKFQIASAWIKDVDGGLADASDS